MASVRSHSSLWFHSPTVRIPHIWTTTLDKMGKCIVTWWVEISNKWDDLKFRAEHWSSLLIRWPEIKHVFTSGFPLVTTSCKCLSWILPNVVSQKQMWRVNWLSDVSDTAVLAHICLQSYITCMSNKEGCRGKIAKAKFAYCLWPLLFISREEKSVGGRWFASVALNKLIWAWNT